MTDFASMNLPAFGVLPSAKRGSAKDIVIRFLGDSDVFEKVTPCFSNGGVCGHKVMDLKVAVDEIRHADKSNELGPYKLNDFELGTIVKNALRSKYMLDKNWRISGLNPKIAALITAQ